MADFDLSGVLSALGAASGSSQQAGQEIQANRAKIAATFDAQQQAVDANASADAVITAQKDNANILAQQNNLRAATSMGTNMQDVNQIITKLGNDMVNNYQAAAAQQQRVNKINANANLSNPLGLIYDVIAGDSERAQLEGYQQNFALASDTLQKLNQATQTVAITNNALKVTDTTATAAANQDKIAANAQIMKAQLQEKLIGVDTNMLQAANQMTVQSAQLVASGFSASLSQRRLDMEEAQQQFMNDQRVSNKKESDALLNAWNTGRAALGGLPPGNQTDMKMEMQLNKERFDLTAMNGYNIMTASKNGTAPSISYGSSPLDSLVNIQKARLQLPGPQEMLGKSLTNIATAATAISPQNLATIMNIKPAEAQMMLADKKNMPKIQNAIIQNQAAQQLQLIDPGNDNSLYPVPPISFLKNDPNLQNNKFLASTLGPSVEAGGQNVKFNFNQLLAQANQDINNKKYSTQEVADGIAYVARKVMLNNDATRNYTGFGLSPMMSYGKLNVNLSVPTGEINFMGSGELHGVVNLADPVQIINYMTRVQARTPASNFSGRLNKLLSDNAGPDLSRLLPPGRESMPGANVVPGGPNRMIQ